MMHVHTEAQLALSLGIRRSVFVEEQQVPIELEIDEWDRLDSAARHVLIEQNGEPAAAGRLVPYGQQAAKLQRIAVLKAERGKGLGRKTVQALEALARAEGYAEAVLDAQLYARAFYEKLGYRAVSEDIFDDAGIPHIRMKKELFPRS